MTRNIISALLCVVFVPPAHSRPYYAAAKGLSCAACHISPTGGGMRKVREGSPGRLTDNISLGADLRVYFSKIERSKVSSFTLARSAVSVAASPRPDTDVVVQYHYDEEHTAQAYGIWRLEGDLPLYVRAGRFWIPYGLLWDDPDNSIKLHNTPFAPGVGFNMSASNSDTGVEVGLAPKKLYFLNLALTNGQPAGGGDNNDSKAFSARGGIIQKHFMLGGSFFRNKTGRLTTDSVRTRFGPMAWIHAGLAALLYEGGFGENKPNSGAAKTRLQGHALELDLEPCKGWLTKARFDAIDPDTGITKDDTQRYTVAVERLMDGVSIEVQYRIEKEENPSVKNNQVFIQSHLWF